MRFLVYLSLISLVCASSLVQCSRQTDVCLTGDIRLANKTSFLEGRVEVCKFNQWGTVCDDNFETESAEVVCKQLGFSGEGASVFQRAKYGEGVGLILIGGLNCTGNENRLADCRPNYKCKHDEDVGVRCSKSLGVKIVSKNELYRNNTLVTAEDINSSTAGLSCITDKVPCCSQDNTPTSGNWFTPTGNVVPSELNETNETWVYTRRFMNQTMELKFQESVPTYGIYRCQLPDQYNIIHDLYIGIYSNRSGGEVTVSNMTYDKYAHTVVCTTSRGPATSVVWYKDNIQLLLNNNPFYEFSQVVLDTQTAAYENKLTILNKSFTDSGEYVCRVENAKGSAIHALNVSVCRDGETMFVERGRGSTDHVLSVCIDDDWLPFDQQFVLYEMQSGSDHGLKLQADTQSVTFLFDSHSKIAKYQLECTANISTLKNTVSSTIIESKGDGSNVDLLLSGLVHSTDYHCCVTLYNDIDVVHGLRLIHKDCQSITTLRINDTVPELSCPNQPPCTSATETGLTIGLGSAMVLFLLVLVVVIAAWIVSCLKRSKTTWTPTTTVNNTSPNRLSAYEERHVDNPIYSSPMQPRVERVGTTNPIHTDERMFAANPVYGSPLDTRPESMYAHVGDFVKKDLIKSSSLQYIPMCSAVVNSAAMHVENENTYMQLN